MGWLMEAFQRVAEQDTGRHRAFTAQPAKAGQMVVFPVRMDDLERSITQSRNALVLAETDRAKIDLELKAAKEKLEEYVKTEQGRFDEYVAGLIKDLDAEFGPKYAENTERTERVKKDMRERQELLADKVRHCGIKAEVVG